MPANRVEGSSMRKSILYAIPVAGLLMIATLGDTSAQQPAQKKGSKTAPVPAMATHFEVYEDKGGSFRFRLKRGDDTLAIASKGYDSKADVRKVIETIQKEAARAKITEAAKDDKP